MAFHLYLSIFHFGQIKANPWEKNLASNWFSPFCAKSKNKTHFKWMQFAFGGHMGFALKPSPFESTGPRPSGMTMLRDLGSHIP